ncbi:MAG: hypothetical protein ABI818_00195 [Acidobacteriota bacterium]
MTVLRSVNTIAVVVAHPGHELAIYHWIETHPPIYCCLTDGSGGAATSRLTSTSRLLKHIGASVGPIYGRCPDRQFYRLLLDRRVDVFVALAHELATALDEARVDCVAGDAVEGFNPAHDVCRLIVDGAVAIIRRRTGREVRNYDFPLDGPPQPPRPGSIVLKLDEAALERKLTAARAYPELRAEVEASLGRYGRQAFAMECLGPAATNLPASRFEQELPAYERYGATRVTEGRYSEIVRYRDHVRPVAMAIKDAAG